jgi:hypothetical protein
MRRVQDDHYNYRVNKSVCPQAGLLFEFAKRFSKRFSIYNDESSDYLKDIFDSITTVEEFVAGIKFKYFKNDRKTIFAAIRCFEVIGEVTKKIPIIGCPATRSSS